MKQYHTELHLINSLLKVQENEGSLELAEEKRLLAALDYIRETSCAKALDEGPGPVDDEDALTRRLDHLVEMMTKVQDWQFDLAENQTILRREQRRVKKALDKRIPVADKGSFMKGMGIGLITAPLGFSGSLGIIVIIMKLADWMNLPAGILGSLLICALIGVGIYTCALTRDTNLLNFNAVDEYDDGYEFADWTEALNVDDLSKEGETK